MKRFATSTATIALVLLASAGQAEENPAKREVHEKDGIASRQFTPLEKQTLKTTMSKAFDALGGKPKTIAKTVLSANKEMDLHTIKGNSMALEVEIDPQEARWVQLCVLRSPDAQEETVIRFYNFDRRIGIWYATQSQLVLDTTYSSQSPEAWIHPPEKAMLARRGIEPPGQRPAPAEPLKLRVLVDGNVVGVFANKKLFMAARVSPGRADSVGVSLKACGQDAVLKSLKAWQMKRIRPRSK